MNPSRSICFWQRVASVDAYRGAVILLMMTDVLALADVDRAFPGHSILRFLSCQQTHVEWAGLSLWDLIQPSFSFLVGVALPFSLLRRQELGQPQTSQAVHAIRRALLLVFLGLVLRYIDSLGSPTNLDQAITRLTFEDTLTQIGLGYFFCICWPYVQGTPSGSLWV